MGKSQKYKAKKGKKQSGGMDASTYSQAVYGSANQQHAAIGEGNLIAAKYVSNCSVVGGKGKKHLSSKQKQQEQQQQQDGGNILQDVAVPALLLYANQTFGKKRTSKRFNKSRRFTRSRYSRRR